MKSSIICQMELKKFPFDKLFCHLHIDSLRNDFVLDWDVPSAALLHKGSISLAEFYLIDMETITGDANATIDETEQVCTSKCNSLLLTFTLGREYGFYLMDYYVPSILIVILSWLTFWITADCVPPRVLLGTSTLLTFIQLEWTDSTIPKVTPFKANDVWSTGCITFIFLSLVEFAFVNTIDRREPSQKVALKKATSKHILRSTLTPKPPRDRKRRSSSCPSSPEIRKLYGKNLIKPRHRTVQDLSGKDLSKGIKAAIDDMRRESYIHKLPTFEELKMESKKVKTPTFRLLGSSSSGSPPMRRKSVAYAVSTMFTMTPQEVAMWIDNKSKIVFPVGFLIFNLCYWSFLWL